MSLNKVFLMAREQKSRLVGSILARMQLGFYWNQYECFFSFHRLSFCQYSKDDVIVLLPWFQVLLHQGFLHSIRDDLLFHVWCSCLLANPTYLLDCPLCTHNETPNCAHDQVQIHSVQHRQTGDHLIPLILLPLPTTTFQ